MMPVAQEGGRLGPAVTRRRLLEGLGVAAAAVYIARVDGGFLGSSSYPAPSSSGMPLELTLERFVPHLGSTFFVRNGPEVLPSRVKLVEALPRRPHRADRPDVTGEAFSLIFAGQITGQLGARIPTVTHPAVGRFRLFLSPVGRGVKRQEYEAVVDTRVVSR